MAQSQIKQVSMRQLFVSGVIATVSVLRHNENNYPYVTLLNKKSESQNVYFGKNSAARIDAAYNNNESIIKELKAATIVESTNADGDVRFKVSLPGETDYASSADLAALFGVEEEAGELDMVAFKAGFTPAPAPETPSTAANTDAIKNAGKGKATAGAGKGK